MGLIAPVNPAEPVPSQILGAVHYRLLETTYYTMISEKTIQAVRDLDIAVVLKPYVNLTAEAPLRSDFARSIPRSLRHFQFHRERICAIVSVATGEATA